MKMYLAGDWQDTSETIDVINPFDGSVVDTTPSGTAEHVDLALCRLRDGAEVMRNMPAYKRCEILRKTGQLLVERQEEFGQIISREEGKILAEGRTEAIRAGEIFDFSADEARNVTGEMVPLDASPNGAGKIGFTLRVPCGIVAAITPFNFPLHLVSHKVGPAIAGGNAILLKPASDTPLSALKLVEVLLEAGLPEQAIACITGRGRALGNAICSDNRVRKISFTGSYDVGVEICRVAGMKKVTMELGSNSPVIVMDDADINKVANVLLAAGYANAGQTCISAQRVLVARSVRADLLDALVPLVEKLTVGDQLQDGTKVGPLVRESDAVRVEEWIKEAVSSGAKLLTGGTRTGAVVTPAVLDEVDPKMRISCEELFGPALAVSTFNDIDEAIRMANDTTLGLSAGIFTQDIDRAMKFAREVQSGNLHINWASQWRVDQMPYGGLKHSGMGKEGPKYAVREMTEEKMVVLHINN